MLDIAWPELIVIGAVALVAVGPKDLPKVMHALGRLAGKARNTMHDLRVCIEQVSYEAEMAEKKEKEKEEKTPPEPTDGQT
ncbi:MAG: twin-arginine translocase TatA/TatE family subunit [Alphaproteobacteria bacterium]|nr:twin-arginine translocase TatA/TatE family subunit [Alphaproteobacteria bacterium]